MSILVYLFGFHIFRYCIFETVWDFTPCAEINDSITISPSILMICIHSHEYPAIQILLGFAKVMCLFVYLLVLTTLELRLIFDSSIVLSLLSSFITKLTAVVICLIRYEVVHLCSLLFLLTYCSNLVSNYCVW